RRLMKKLIFPIIIMVLILAACGKKSENGSDSNKDDTKAYKLDSGKKKDIPKNHKSIAVVAPTYADVIKYSVEKIVADNKQINNNHILKEKFIDVEKVGENDVEKVAKTKPYLIITYSTDKNIKKYKKIAPTVVYDYGKHKYLD